MNSMEGMQNRSTYWDLDRNVGVVNQSLWPVESKLR